MRIKITCVVGLILLSACGGNNGSSHSNSSSVTQSSDSSSDSSSSMTNQPMLTIQENQSGFCRMQGAVENDHTGYTGTGYVNATNVTGAGITWQLSAAQAGTYELTWRYANGGGASRVASIHIDGVQNDVLNFDTTSGWTDYQEQTTTVTLNAGENTLLLTSETEMGLANIDSLMVVGDGLTPVPCAGASSSSSSSSSSSFSSAPVNPQACVSGSTETAWAESCPTASTHTCTAGTWQATPRGSDGQTLRFESEHFAFYWNDGTNISTDGAQTAANTLEMIWDRYFNSSINFPEPYCGSSTKYKATIHFDNDFPLWGGAWNYNGTSVPGMWVGPGAANDQWGLAHEFMHGVQSLTPAFPECGGNGCWIYESHANWMPHQIFQDNVHCSEMLANSAHLHYGNTRNRYCNWQFFEYLKDKHCPNAVNEMWTSNAPAGQRDPFQKLMYSRGWDIEQLNDLFGEWAMHNVTWDYRNPDGSDQGTVYRNAYGPITGNNTNYSQRRLRLTQLESMDAEWRQTRRFSSPYYWAPQRWGYNVIRLHPEADASSVNIKFRGVIQSGADSGWRWGLVATDSNLNNPRYSPLQQGADGELNFCIGGNETVFLVVLAAPTQYQKITWQQPMDGTAYPSIYRYPYMLEVDGAWPDGFAGGSPATCPSGTVRHANGGGCAPASTPSSVFVGPYAKILGGNVSGNARIEDHATILSGTVSDNATIGAMTVLGVNSNPHHGPANFNATNSAKILATFYPMGWFGNNQTVSGTAIFKGDLEAYSGKSQNTFYGLVDNGTSGVSEANEVTVPPPYEWRP